MQTRASLDSLGRGARDLGVLTLLLLAAPDLAGVVRLDGEVPPQGAVVTASDPACGRKAPVDFMLDEDRLGNVLVWIDDAPPEPPPVHAPPTVIELEECAFRPQIAGMRAGTWLEVVNRDPTLHTVRASGMFHWVLPGPGSRRKVRLDEPRVMVELTDEVHQWMWAHLAVLPHGRFGVTDANGAFAIDLEGLPPGTYTLRFWHERLGPRSRAFVSDGRAARVDMTFVFDPAELVEPRRGSASF